MGSGSGNLREGGGGGGVGGLDMIQMEEVF